MSTSGNPHARRFSLVDAIGLIAAVGVGLAFGRGYYRCLLGDPHLIVSAQPSYLRVPGAREWALACVPALVAVTLVLWPLRLVPPRPRSRRRAPPPGLLASHAATLAMAAALAKAGLVRWAYGRSYSIYSPHGYIPLGLGERLGLHVVASKDLIGPAVAASWLILWLGGGWRPERTWIDRAGRLLGASWIAIELAGWSQGLFTR